jgi:hypothetical protein
MEESLTRLRGLWEGAISSSDADESESNKFNARFGFSLAVPIPASEAFSATLSPEDFTESFLSRPKGLAVTTRWGDVLCVSFLQNARIKAKNFASTLTHGGDTFSLELTKSRGFGSSGFSLTFEGLLLGGKPSPISEGYLK